MLLCTGYLSSLDFSFLSCYRGIMGKVNGFGTARIKIQLSVSLQGRERLITVSCHKAIEKRQKFRNHQNIKREGFEPKIELAHMK